MTLLDRIKEAVGLKKPADIARFFGLTNSAVSQWKKGKQLGIETMQAIEAKTRYRGLWVATGMGPKTYEREADGWPFPDIDRERFKRLTPNQKIEIQGAVRAGIVEFEKESAQPESPPEPPPGAPSGEFSNSRPEPRRKKGNGV